MSYDLRLIGDGTLDLDAARAALGGGDGVEVEWERDTLSATFVLAPREIGVGVVGDDAPPAERARDFAALLDVVMAVARRAGARVHDPQLGRELTPADVPAAVRDFAEG